MSELILTCLLFLFVPFLLLLCNGDVERLKDFFHSSCHWNVSSLLVHDKAKVNSLDSIVSRRNLGTKFSAGGLVNFLNTSKISLICIFFCTLLLT